MASISREPNGRRTVQFVGADGKRRSVRLGECNQRQAEIVRLHVERLAAAKRTGGNVPEDTARWLDQIGDILAERLAKADLIPPRASATLGAFIRQYIDGRTDVKHSTRITLERARAKLVEHFGESRDLRTITEGEADEFALWLERDNGGKLAAATARKTVSIAKQMFRAARRRKLIRENPFQDLAGAVPANRSRDYFVSRADADQVLAACPDIHWRTLFALARFGGLRTPSESFGLKWTDVNWETGRFTVRAPKTERHAGHQTRIVPLFPELRAVLMEAFEAAEPGAVYVLPWRDTTINLRKGLMTIIRRAGLEPWPKLYQNLRASRETELLAMFPQHCVLAWIGHSRQVSLANYAQVLDTDFERAIADAKAVQNPVQHAAAGSRLDSQHDEPELVKSPVCESWRGEAAAGETFLENQVGVTGLEPVTSSV
jgi:integrase